VLYNAVLFTVEVELAYVFGGNTHSFTNIEIFDDWPEDFDIGIRKIKKKASIRLDALQIRFLLILKGYQCNQRTTASSLCALPNTEHGYTYLEYCFYPHEQAVLKPCSCKIVLIVCRKPCPVTRPE
jgi:hypothetical protein